FVALSARRPRGPTRFPYTTLFRSGASNRQMATLMGVRVPLLFLSVFTLGAMLAAAAGALMGPISAVQIGMGEDILILVLVCIVIDRKSTRLNSSHVKISYAVFCLK